MSGGGGIDGIIVWYTQRVSSLKLTTGSRHSLSCTIAPHERKSICEESCQINQKNAHSRRLHLRAGYERMTSKEKEKKTHVKDVLCAMLCQRKGRISALDSAINECTFRHGWGTIIYTLCDLVHGNIKKKTSIFQE